MEATSYVHQVPNGRGGFMFLHVGTLLGLRGPEAGCDLNLHAIGDGMSIFKLELRHASRSVYKHPDMCDGLDEMERLLRETLLPSDPQKAPMVMFISTMNRCLTSIHFENTKTGLGVAVLLLFIIEEDKCVPVGEWALQACRERDDGRAELITMCKKMLETQAYAESSAKDFQTIVSCLQRNLNEQEKVIETLRARLQLHEEKDSLSRLKTAVSASEQRIRELEEKVEKGSEEQDQGTVEAGPETVLIKAANMQDAQDW